MAIQAQGLTVYGINDQRKQFSDLPLVMRLLRWVGTAFTETVGIGDNSCSPRLPLTACRKVSAYLLHQTGFSKPSWMGWAPKVLAHPLALARLRAKVVLGSVGDAAQRAEHGFSALITCDFVKSFPLFSPICHSAGGTTEARGPVGSDDLKNLTTLLASLFHKITSIDHYNIYGNERSMM